MQEENKGDKIRRVLQLYAKLSDGYVINKAEEAAYYGVTERSITRDIDDIRNFLDEDSERTGIVNNVVYDRMAKGYRLETLYKIRLQTAHVLDEENGEYIVAAEVFGTGINMWIRSQGDYIEMIEEV